MERSAGGHADLKRIVEALLFAAREPISVAQIESAFLEDERPERSAIVAAIEEIIAEYRERPIELREVASGFRFQVRQEMSPWVSRLLQERPAKYSRALLETLAIITYRQPVTRGGIEEIRGVSVTTAIMRTLLERNWVRVIGHKEVPGRPALYATTKQFLDYFDLRTLDQLPSLKMLQDRNQALAEIALRSDADAQAQDSDGSSA